MYGRALVALNRDLQDHEKCHELGVVGASEQSLDILIHWLLTQVTDRFEVV